MIPCTFFLSLFANETLSIQLCSIVIYRYVRVKRQHQTFCFLCEPSETIRSVKEKVGAALAQHEKANHTIPSIDAFRLLHADAARTVLDDTETIESIQSAPKTEEGSNKTPNDTVPALLFYLVFPSSDAESGEEWEPVQVVNTDIE